MKLRELALVVPALSSESGPTISKKKEGSTNISKCCSSKINELFEWVERALGGGPHTTPWEATILFSYFASDEWSTHSYFSTPKVMSVYPAISIFTLVLLFLKFFLKLYL